ncbi:MAG: phosphate-starvation-inducible PsiE family protein [Deltaproteobacteria bacterium]|nr:phosphate-starvation-inducible PsiE family protein [Deltaproteobacteria bacterium]
MSELMNKGIRGFANRAAAVVDDIVLFAVAIAIICVAILLLYEGATDFLQGDRHSIPHIVSDLLFVLIIMELFRQVSRQINRRPFSLNPFIYIGIIASIRGVLIMQMKIGLGEAEWSHGVAVLLADAVLVLIFLGGLYIYSKCRKDVEEH